MFKKVRQSWWYSVAGLIALFLTTFIAIAFGLGNIPSIIILVGIFSAFYIVEEYFLSK